MDLLWLLWYLLIALFGFLVFIDFRLRNDRKYITAAKMAGPKMYPIIGNLPMIFGLTSEETFLMIRKLSKQYTNGFRFWVFGRLLFHITRCNDAEVILTTTKHLDKGMIYKFLHPFLGSGLLTGSGSKWHQRRKILTPAFHFNILQEFFGIFKEESVKLLSTLDEDISKQNYNETTIQSIMSKTTLNIIVETAMGIKLEENSEEYRQKVYDIGSMMIYRALRPWLFPDFIYTILGYRKQLMKVIEPTHQFTKNIIEQRRKLFNENKLSINDVVDDENIYETKKKRAAMLDTLLASEAKGKIDVEGIREEVDTFTFEGHDTTAAGMVFTLLLIANNPEEQQLVFEEIEQFRKEKDGEELGINDFNDMKYLDRFIKECLRIYPPVPLISRELPEDLKYDNVLMPAGSECLVHIYEIHRDPNQFPDPEKFDPDRFLPENIAQRHPFAYVPFSAGPRNCIGQKYAILEMKTLITNILWNFKVLPVTKREDIVFYSDIVLRCKTQVKVKFVKRERL